MNWFEPTEEQETQWKEFVRTRPDPVREVIEAHVFAPWKLYRMKSTGHRVTIYSFDEPKDGPVTMKVDVGGEFNVVTFSRRVFGVSPEDLVECDLPETGEPVGDLEMDPHEAKALIDEIRKGVN